MTEPTITEQTDPSPRRSFGWIIDLVLVVFLLAGAALRTAGVNWDENQHLHPDERFLTMVETGIQPVGTPDERLGPPPSVSNQPWRAAFETELPDCEKWGGYFDTACSPLNPNNRGYDFYVYGSLPIFFVRYVAEWFNQTGYDQVHLVGRQLSALADLGSIFLLYLIASRLYGRRVGLLAAAFSSLAVLQIQQSHFFTVDTFTNLFMFLAIYFAVLVWDETRQLDELAFPTVREFFRHRLFAYSLLFGLGLGMAVASKINAAPLAVLLPGAFALGLLNRHRLGSPEFERLFLASLGFLVAGGIASLLVFRIFQPYAFSGPGFFDLSLNPNWLKNLRDLRAQTTGDVDFPPALQWARRPIWFSWQNMILWGLGLPLGLTAWAGFLWMGWHMLKGEWRRHLLLWSWLAVYTLWQGLVWNRTMRYQLPVYPLLAMTAAWGIVRLGSLNLSFKRFDYGRLTSALLGAIVLVTTAAWAYGFTSIYTRPVTRVAATRWIYQNVPGPVNLRLENGEGGNNQPLSMSPGASIRPGQPLTLTFTARTSGDLREVYLPHVLGQSAGGSKSLQLLISSDNGAPLQELLFAAPDPASGLSGMQTLQVPSPVMMAADQVHYLTIQMLDLAGEVDLCGAITVHLEGVNGPFEQIVNPPADCVLRDGSRMQLEFSPFSDGLMTEIRLDRAVNVAVQAGEQALALTLAKTASAEQVLAQAELKGDLSPAGDPRGEGFLVSFDRVVPLQSGEVYSLKLELASGNGAVTLSGAAPANESSWDDGLPLRMDGYDGFGGIYRGGLNFEMYWDDNEDKRTRFYNTLDQADYIFISSNRQWGTTVRVPERYPLTTTYYRSLIGCPAERDLLWCYSEAEPGMFQGELGFELVQVFQSYPTLSIPGLGEWQINDQYAEEAFTVYDHPKVLIFRKSENYSQEQVRAVLDSVDLTRVVRLTPRRASSYPSDLMLPLDRLAAQRAGGTWSELFDLDALVNRSPAAGLVVWYLAILVLGVFTYPLLRALLPGLSDRGYPLARTAGLVIWTYFAWLAGSLGIPYSRTTIAVLYGLLALAGIAFAFQQRESLKQELRSRGKYFLLVEGLFLAFFVIDLLIRLGNPDLWHPYKGGERPMDFSYLNAVLKSTTFPPYDPWFAGGYINYYYYGFVLVGTPIKFLGIVPSVAYNLVLPALYAMLALGGFSAAWNLVAALRKLAPGSDEAGENKPGNLLDQWIAGLSSAAGLVLLGNLGTVRMFYQGFQRLAAPEGDISNAAIFTRLGWAVQGFFKAIGGTDLPFRIGDWYWLPSRIIPAPNEVEPITEFPLFTFLYSDLHAHMIALPVALLALAWALSVVLARGKWSGAWTAALSFLFGGVVIGALRPTNTWDLPTYLALGLLAAGYGLWHNSRAIPVLSILPEASRRIVSALLGAAAITALSLFLYQPFADWYGLGYGSVEMWKGTHTPIWSYLSHWGLFLFFIVSWMTWETRDWLDTTPVSALARLRSYRLWIEIALLLLVAAVLALLFLKVQIAWLVLPLAAWAGILLLRPGLADAKRAVLFMVGTGLVLTLVVEVVVLKGDIARMNTVFKFYLQVWTLFAVSAAASIGWLVPAIPVWLPGWRNGWQTSTALLFAGAALFTLLGGADKIRDRMEPEAPRTLDSMTYMRYARYSDQGVEMDLSQDYNAIRWMQENVTGSPVIVEGNTVEYRWGSRFTIYTGLPSVVGWNWHQRQQRAVTPPNWVTDRVADVANFYTTVDDAQAEAFLRKYDVSYIVVGQLEKAYYLGPGLEKFPALEGKLWQEVYRDRNTAIYEVLR